MMSERGQSSVSGLLSAEFWISSSAAVGYVPPPCNLSHHNHSHITPIYGPDGSSVGYWRMNHIRLAAQQGGHDSSGPLTFDCIYEFFDCSRTTTRRSTGAQ